METVQVDILNPKGRKVPGELAEQKLISIRRPSKEGLIKVLDEIRTSTEKNDPNLPVFEEITEEVEIVRAERHAKSLKSNC